MKKTKNRLYYQNYSQNNSGLTLIELLVASAILSVLALGFLGVQFIISENQVSVWKSYLSVEDANLVISGMVKELRGARPSDTGAYPLQVVNDAEIIFYSDIDYDGATERVRYTLSGSDITKGIIEPQGSPVTYPLASEKARLVTNIARNNGLPVFYYYNENWPSDTVNNPLPQALRISDTRQIKIIIRTNPKLNDADNDFILESDIRLRMLN